MRTGTYSVRTAHWFVRLALRHAHWPIDAEVSVFVSNTEDSALGFLRSFNLCSSSEVSWYDPCGADEGATLGISRDEGT
jgi:hypothetical protein